MVLLALGIFIMVITSGQGKTEIITTSTPEITYDSAYRTEELILEEDEIEDDRVISEENKEEWGSELLENSEFAYFYGMEEDEDLPKRFGYVVEEAMEEREVPLEEEDFKKLKKGQYFFSGRESATIPIGIVDVIGWFDGEIMHTARAPGSGIAKVSFYYKIDDSTYIILFFEHNLRSYPLERIEVWDAEGNKLRDIDIV